MNRQTTRRPWSEPLDGPKIRVLAKSMRCAVRILARLPRAGPALDLPLHQPQPAHSQLGSPCGCLKRKVRDKLGPEHAAHQRSRHGSAEDWWMVLERIPVTPPLQIFLIRHGETAWSLTGQYTGRTDIPLTPHGVDLARRLARCLRRITFAQVLSSPRLRARMTCELAGFPAPGIEPDLAEWDYGDYEGQRSVETRQTHPDWDLWRDGCPGGESPVQVADRADRLISRLAALDGNIALFTHGHFGRVLAARWVGWAAKEGRHLLLEPARVGVLTGDVGHADRRVIASWNVDPSSGTFGL